MNIDLCNLLCLFNESSAHYTGSELLTGFTETVLNKSPRYQLASNLLFWGFEFIRDRY